VTDEAADSHPSAKK